MFQTLFLFYIPWLYLPNLLWNECHTLIIFKIPPYLSFSLFELFLFSSYFCFVDVISSLGLLLKFFSITQIISRFSFSSDSCFVIIFHLGGSFACLLHSLSPGEGCDWPDWKESTGSAQRSSGPFLLRVSTSSPLPAHNAREPENLSEYRVTTSGPTRPQLSATVSNLVFKSSILDFLFINLFKTQA